MYVLCSVSGQGKAVSTTKEGETCSFLDGVFVSVMRRIFSQGFHKQLLSEVEVMPPPSLATFAQRRFDLRLAEVDEIFC